MHVPIKHKYIRATEAPFINKEYKRAVMLRSKLQNKYNNEPSIQKHTAYKMQRNICTNLLRNIKFNFYNNLNPTSISDNKIFWKNVKPMYSEKKTSNTNINLLENHHVISEKKTSNTNINLVENHHVISDDNKIAGCFKNVFGKYCKRTEYWYGS